MMPILDRIETLGLLCRSGRREAWVRRRIEAERRPIDDLAGLHYQFNVSSVADTRGWMAGDDQYVSSCTRSKRAPFTLLIHAPHSSVRRHCELLWRAPVAG